MSNDITTIIYPDKKDYDILKIDEECLKEIITKGIGKNISEENIIECLKTGQKIPYNQIMYFCGPKWVEEGSKEFILPKKILSIFQKGDQYCKDHEADYALLQNLKIKGISYVSASFVLLNKKTTSL